jgi:hypothetical protein
MSISVRAQNIIMMMMMMYASMCTLQSFFLLWPAKEPQQNLFIPVKFFSPGRKEFSHFYLSVGSLETCLSKNEDRMNSFNAMVLSCDRRDTQL